MKHLIENGEDLVSKWGAALKGIDDSYTRKVVATLYENQAKAILLEKSKKIDESSVAGYEAATSTGSLGTFQKFAFPLIRRVFPQLIANAIVAQQPMQGPVGQVFYLGSGRQYGSTRQSLYSKYQLTYQGSTTAPIGMVGNSLDIDSGAPELSAIYNRTRGSASTTFGGRIAGWPDSSRIHGFNVSAGEFLSGSAIPEVNISIEQQPLIARTRKMRTLWTIEASQDLKAYHNLDLEQELTELMGNELRLEIDREILENLRGIAYDTAVANGFGGWYRNTLDLANSQAIGNTGGADSFTPDKFQWDFTGGAALPTNPTGTSRNVWVIDFSSSAFNFNPQHVGQVWSNMWAALNLMSQDIYKTTHRGPGSWIVTSPLVGAMLETAAQLGGGMGGNGGSRVEGPTNMGGQIQFKGKLGGKYDLYIDPLWPEDEILMGYKGTGPMDTGFVYAPYIPIENLPTVVDPATFQPRKGIMTRYGMVAISPEARFYRVLRIIGPSTLNYLYAPFERATNVGNVTAAG